MYKKNKADHLTLQSNELDDMILKKTLKETNKLALTDANKDLIEIHKQKEVGNNFIMKAFRSQKKIDAGVESSREESSLDEEIYYN